MRRRILRLPNVVEGRSYGRSAFLLNGRFLARFRDGDTVLVLQLATIDDRDFLMRLDPHAFFFTEHYRNYPAVLVRLAEVPRDLLAEVVEDSWRHVSSLPPRQQRPTRRGRTRR
ncbi:MAG: MmcQ/YjbR family DNA-binding protein [Gemmatimonadales bacterium]